MTLLSKEAILKADDREVREVEVREWGGAVLVRGLNGRDRDQWFASLAQVSARPGRQPEVRPDIANLTARLVAMCVLDPDDPQRERLMFTAGDVAQLGDRSAAALNRVYEAAMELSGLSEEDMSEVGKVSGTTLSAGSTSSSPGS